MTIELINSTPFVPFQFESVDANLNHFGVVVLRGTFKIQNRTRLRLCEVQESLLLTDEYFGDRVTSSLRYVSSLAPYKPKTDVLVEAKAYSPSGRPETNWICRIQANGGIDKSFRVTGPRNWSRKLGSNRLTSTEPIDCLDVRYEYAFGGFSEGRNGHKFNPNPVGLGYGESIARCPQLLPVDLQEPRFNTPIQPQGIGPIAPDWSPRFDFSGTYDDQWKKTRAPYLPLDFSFEFYNAASIGLTFPGFANGDEIFHLSNLSVDRDLSFGLPEIQLITLIELDDGRVFPGPLNLDTIELQVEESKAFLSWRGIYPAHFPIRRIEIRMSAPEYMVEA